MKQTKSYTFTDVVVINHDMFVVDMKNKVKCHVKSAEIIAK